MIHFRFRRLKKLQLRKDYLIMKCTRLCWICRDLYGCLPATDWYDGYSFKIYDYNPLGSNSVTAGYFYSFE